ncbi:MAG: hypothetical protein GEU96_01795 [Propionibacteriales bacterium]|nr:hypothetical protein [Propionibacteriales bacterium]
MANVTNDDAIEVRRGVVDGVEAPEQFLWQGRLWLVHEVVGHWIETGSWWESPTQDVAVIDPPAEREVWRVDAANGRTGSASGAVSGQRGVFDLVFDWGLGAWRLQATTG